ncbi:unnamed protein product [Oppiella nova]|uniref:Uncharacterized protein n=1 Tax=Oppiella nova TaxID=334625 RepID=A0A7R9LTT7_9ACAR|nr:unnamed protein product [Oppiella nova]CAG2166905.1 unnamed protein product [Oppiella nova]
MVDNQKSNVKHIADIVGEWGKWQLHLASFSFILWAVAAINNMGYSFHAYDNDFWCSDVPYDYPCVTELISRHFRKHCICWGTSYRDWYSHIIQINTAEDLLYGWDSQ